MYEDLKVQMAVSGPPAAEEDLRLLEREIGVSLPAEYRQFLRELNGATPTPNVFETTSGPDYSCGVSEFFGLHQQNAGNLRKQHLLYVGRVPGGFLPVAAAAGGNLICLRVVASDHGGVYFWDHESEKSEEAFRKLSESFSTFVHSLRPLRGDEVKLRQEDVIEVWIDSEFLEQLKNSG